MGLVKLSSLIPIKELSTYCTLKVIVYEHSDPHLQDLTGCIEPAHIKLNLVGNAGMTDLVTYLPIKRVQKNKF